VKVKPWRQWSDDALWISFGVALTLAFVIVAYVTMPP
jgi:hypothetical protein